MGGKGSGDLSRTKEARERARKQRIDRGEVDSDDIARKYNKKHPFRWELLKDEEEFFPLRPQ